MFSALFSTVMVYKHSSLTTSLPTNEKRRTHPRATIASLGTYDEFLDDHIHNKSTTLVWPHLSRLNSRRFLKLQQLTIETLCPKMTLPDKYCAAIWIEKCIWKISWKKCKYKKCYVLFYIYFYNAYVFSYALKF